MWLKLILFLFVLLINTKEIYAPLEVDPMDYWDYFLDWFGCNFEDVPVHRETIFDNWRWQMKKGWN